MPLLREHSPSTRILVDSVDIHFLRKARGAFRPLPDGIEGLLDPETGFDMTSELNTYAAADAVLTVFLWTQACPAGQHPALTGRPPPSSLCGNCLAWAR